MLTECPNCGGAVEARTHTGKVYNYRGVECHAPDDLVTPTCTGCGASWVDGTWLKRMSSVMHEQHRLAQARERFPTRLKFQVAAFGKLLDSLPMDDRPTPQTKDD